jgi:predicted ABC-type sugar transport system permease subunit
MRALPSSRISIPRRAGASPPAGLMRAALRRAGAQAFRRNTRQRGDEMELDASVTAVITGGASGLGEATARAGRMACAWRCST